MDQFLSLIGVQAMKYAVRSGIVLTSNYALDQCSRLLTTIDDQKLELELKYLQERLECYLKVISPAIDLVELKSGRGNVFLESAVPITKSLQHQITNLGRDIEDITVAESTTGAGNKPKKSHKYVQSRIRQVISDAKSLLDRIDRDIPLLQLAITSSGESLSTSLPSSISPSRLLQASTFIVMGDSQFCRNSSKPVQIGPTFSLSLYMLFLAHAVPGKTGCTSGNNPQACIYGLGENDRKPMWQEVVHKALVRLYRSNDKGGGQFMTEDGEALPNDGRQQGYYYYLQLDEDLDDGRAHCYVDCEAPLGPNEDSPRHVTIPVCELSKIFYTDKAKLLNIGDASEQETRPILLLKRDVSDNMPMFNHAQRGTSLTEAMCNGRDKTRQQIMPSVQPLPDQDMPQEDGFASIEQKLRNLSMLSNLPNHLDPEWLAFEVFVEDKDEDADSDDDNDEGTLETAKDTQGNEILVWTDVREDAGGDLAVPSFDEASDSSTLDMSGGLSMDTNVTGDSVSQNSNRPAQSWGNQHVTAPNIEAQSPLSGVTTSLSLLEMMTRLAGLQECQQASHLSIPDHILTFFLEETSTTGLSSAAGETLRRKTMERVGFDPYADDVEREEGNRSHSV
ncbi:Ran-specific GTPase-activating protein 30 [Conoideocrella luteorostrata]|uniref:Ran-specific GTPase-activating protein 30 n=1 Tax=Conoideocrella luteorostrata TaxID=1105319 RepID=A0AAJ0FX95_9HYPO|nr:Ran-specific GTPase-activating protein 30 [Conoideocrella luteorostrata]